MRIFVKTKAKSVAIELVKISAYANWLKQQPADLQRWFGKVWKEAKPGQHIILPSQDGDIASVVAIVSDPVSMWDIAALPLRLPEGIYRLSSVLDADELFRLALGYGLGAYQFTRYKAAKRAPAQLVLPKEIDSKRLEVMVAAQNASRDLINTPAEDLGPPELAAFATDLAAHYGARIKIVTGNQLQKGFPLVHAVGRAGPKPPQLIDMVWGKPNAPKVTLVGKGVCFDTGGLDVKPPAGMYNMKKDMGGAAGVLAIARMVMEAKLNVRLRVIIPAVENSVDSTSIRPRDVVKSRAGITVEIQDTDAEGRLILADALALAAEEEPDILIDMATLTGSKLPMFGLDIGVFFCADDATCDALMDASRTMEDPLWRGPIWEPYGARLDSHIADTMQCANGHADPILATLFMKKFALPKPNSKTIWLHADIMCMHMADRPGRPEGGEAQAARALYWFLQEKFG